MTKNENTPATGEAGLPGAEGANVTTPPAEETKTFTQAELNRIVQERLAKEKGKNEAALAAREQELNGREFRLTAQTILGEHKLPTELLDILKADDEKSLRNALGILDKHFNYSNPHRVRFPPCGRVDERQLREDDFRTAFGLRK